MRTPLKADRKTSHAVAQQVTKKLEQREPKSFIVAELAQPPADSGLPAEAEAPLSNELVDSRLRFVTKCRDGHWQFDELRRAHWSTMMILACLGGPP